MDSRTRWLVFSPLGLALVGFGASLLGHAVELKTNGAPLAAWFWWGTGALVTLNAGLAVFGDAVKARVLLELAQRGDPS